LSFLVIVWIWWVYNSLTKRLKMERGEVFAFNIFLLFLVVIEPYLLTIIDKVAGATAYAIDLGTILMILAIFNEYLIRDTPKEDRNELRHRRSSRVSSLILASIFYASAILGYIPETRSLGVQYDVWLLALMFAILSRLRYRDHSSHNE
jgi:uncharacterized membrane protein